MAEFGPRTAVKCCSSVTNFTAGQLSSRRVDFGAYATSHVRRATLPLGECGRLPGAYGLGLNHTTETRRRNALRSYFQSSGRGSSSCPRPQRLRRQQWRDNPDHCCGSKQIRRLCNGRRGERVQHVQPEHGGRQHRHQLEDQLRHPLGLLLHRQQAERCSQRKVRQDGKDLGQPADGEVHHQRRREVVRRHSRHRSRPGAAVGRLLRLLRRRRRRGEDRNVLLLLRR